MTPASPEPTTGTGDGAFEALARDTVDDLLRLSPEAATALGDHRYDDRLTDLRPESLDDSRRVLAQRLAQLEQLPRSDGDAALSVGARVDAAILRRRLEEQLFALDEIRGHEWDPLVANPGTAVYLLLARDYAPLEDRLRAAVGRLAGVPEALDVARRTLHDMPRVHVETAVGQFAGTAALLGAELDRALDQAPTLRSEVEPVRDRALEAVDEHRRWLGSRLEDAAGDPRLGAERFARKLAHTLDAASDADAVLARAEADLVRLEAEIAEAAARISAGPAQPGQVRAVLDRLAEERPDDDTIVEMSERALEQTTAFVEERSLVTVHDDPVEIIVMPEIHRGVAVAYCDPPGPLETAPLPTYFAISPTPQDWPADRVASFFREYNAHMVHNLTVHEAMPGHVLQLAHSRRCAAPSVVRTAFWSGPFVEGWAVYAEETMVAAGYPGNASPGGLRMQQLKMQLRMTINAILDARVHAHGMTEDEAMRLMTERGHQEEGEAAGKWRRALLTSAQLSTYYVGYTEVSDLARDLRAARPGATQRAVHDELLGHGSPPPRHLRTLLHL